MFALLIYLTFLLLGIAAPIALSVLLTGSPLLGIAIDVLIGVSVVAKIVRTLGHSKVGGTR